MDPQQQQVFSSEYVIPVSGPTTTAAARPAMGGAAGDSKIRPRFIIGVIVVLVILVIFVVWWKRYHSKPNCSHYTGDQAQACNDAVAGCRGGGPCLNAVAHCMPIAAKVNMASSAKAKWDAFTSFSERELLNCTNAVARTNPEFLISRVEAAKGGTICLPAATHASLMATTPGQVGRQYNRSVDSALHTAAKLARASKPLVPWAVQVARDVPACPPSAPTTTTTSIPSVTPMTGLQNLLGKL